MPGRSVLSTAVVASARTYQLDVCEHHMTDLDVQEEKNSKETRRVAEVEINFGSSKAARQESRVQLKYNASRPLPIPAAQLHQLPLWVYARNALHVVTSDRLARPPTPLSRFESASSALATARSYQDLCRPHRLSSRSRPSHRAP